MKKQAAIGLFAASMLLASCTPSSGGSSSNITVDGSKSTDSTVVSTVSTTSSSSTSTGPTSASILKGFLDKLEDNNCTLTEKGYMVAKYLGAAKLVTYDEGGEDPSGLIQNGEQGVFEYTVKNDAVVIRPSHRTRKLQRRLHQPLSANQTRRQRDRSNERIHLHGRSIELLRGLRDRS